MVIVVGIEMNRGQSSGIDGVFGRDLARRDCSRGAKGGVVGELCRKRAGLQKAVVCERPRDGAPMKVDADDSGRGVKLPYPYKSSLTGSRLPSDLAAAIHSFGAL